jgi:hypothetical protein
VIKTFADRHTQELFATGKAKKDRGGHREASEWDQKILSQYFARVDRPHAILDHRR